MADSGATVNIMNKCDFDKLNPKPQLISSKTKIYPYMSISPLNILGKFEADLACEYSDRECRETFYVASGPSSSLVSWKTSQKLNLIRVANNIHVSTGEKSTQKKSTEKSTLPSIIQEFPNVTEGMGAYMGNPVRVYVDPNIKPVTQPHRRIPFHVRKQVEKKIEELEKSDIIEKCNGPTPWISPIVVVPKRETQMTYAYVWICDL
ncbi:uncharacterized protein [Haliotis cracherodii]|uniref:uncharacterized protein n=1 Tax=Haliotis cracherodii TaxID=6455 RepID=UPI0039E7BFB7